MKSNAKVIKPIFILGAPRSGTTLLYQILCNHRDLSFFTQNIIRAGVYRKGRILGYNKLWLARIRNLIYKDKLSVQPHEAPECWSPHLGTYEYLTENECTEEIIEHYSQVIAKVQAIFNRPRFINKNPQHCTRVRILNRIFPDAKFVHIVRDRTAVACSTIYASSMSLPTDSYFLGLREKIFPLIGNKNFLRRLSEVQLYELSRDILVSKAREANKFGANRYYEINYEELVAWPRNKINEVLNFCGIGSYPGFEDRLPVLHNENIKWENMLKGKSRFVPVAR